jgi:hypothetical protein
MLHAQPDKPRRGTDFVDQRAPLFCRLPRPLLPAYRYLINGPSYISGRPSDRQETKPVIGCLITQRSSNGDGNATGAYLGIADETC